MKWETRQLKWEDVKITIANFVLRSGKRRVHCSLIGCAFVCKEFWLEDFQKDNPVHQAMILLVLQKKLRRAIHMIKAYERAT